MVGITDKATTKELTKDLGDAIVTYTVSENRINKKDLLVELSQLQAEAIKPTDKELLDLGRSMHPYYTNPNRDTRIAEIQSILGV
jgi:hypothetical protein